MKRYRILSFDFDSRATLLGLEIRDEWEKEVREGHIRTKTEIRGGLVAEFGIIAAEAKIENFLALGPKPWSVVAFHNRFAHQARTAFVMGAYYPALTAICALGERVLNHLVIKLRDKYRQTPEYKLVSQGLI